MVGNGITLGKQKWRHHMSRLTDIIENHQNLDQLFAIIKHYGVSTEYICTALILQFEQKSDQSDENTEVDDEEYSQELVDDLKQFRARF